MAGNPLKYFDPKGLEVYFLCRPLQGRLGQAGGRHCAVFVDDPDTEDSCEAGDRQFSLERGGVQPLPQDDWGNIVFYTDRDAFDNPGGDNFLAEIPPPPGMSSDEWDQAVRDEGGVYSQGAYDPVLGPNSNTAADNIIENADGIAPDVPGAVAQNYGETCRSVCRRISIGESGI